MTDCYKCQLPHSGPHPWCDSCRERVNAQYAAEEAEQRWRYMAEQWGGTFQALAKVERAELSGDAKSLERASELLRMLNAQA